MRASTFAQLNAEYQAKESIGGPYAMCSALAALRMRNSPAVVALAPQHFEVAVEHGDVNQKELFTLVERNPLDFEISAWPKAFEDDEGRTAYFRAFELADLLAFEHRLFIERQGSQREYERKLPPLLEDAFTLDTGLLAVEALRIICEDFKIPRRSRTP
jgi:hypothetical protein